MADSLHHGSSPHHAPRDYAQTPLNIYWEMTQACALACRHCRAEAVPHAHPMQLTFEEGVSFLQQICDFGDPLPQLILTGGDPLERPDLYDLIDEARKLGIGVSITPAATTMLTRDVFMRLKEHNVEGLGLSLDGSTAERHDSIRGIPGTFERTLQAIQLAGELQIPLQVNTLVSAETAEDLSAIYELLKPHAVSRWSLFFLISVGRGKVLQPLSPPEAENLMAWIFEVSRKAPFIVATTEAPSYRRVALERLRDEGLTGEQIKRTGTARSFGIRDGHGIMFVSNTGDICPAGFLPLVVGNVRKDRLVDAYRNAPLFQSLHDPTQFQGRCGICEYKALCGGSRARAFSATGDTLASDPLCCYEPESIRHTS
ncbi:MAG: radical SAM/SPASM domain-containing protein [Acidobacteria bacterium RIFCSPLOWO2_12_FULL_54_10]|nr:MAG: radical SAM/SPASM domain-containing protein [Acidobacteria bacterium RIFCSPLOWO2_12_FULL_54_10]